MPGTPNIGALTPARISSASARYFSSSMTSPVKHTKSGASELILSTTAFK
jgi:hypothetical protein